MSDETLTCPVCGGHVFGVFNGRTNARCTECGSLERGRQVWLVLQKLGVLRPGMRILHFAPERFLMERLNALSRKNYRAYDVDPSRYKHKRVKVRRLDLTVDLPKIPSASADLILHNHVLEHLPCDLSPVLGELNRIVAPGGQHVFTVPFRGDHTAEDLSPGLSDAERTKRFGQADHMRVFGRRDFPEFLSEVCGVDDPIFHIDKYYSHRELRSAGIPVGKAGAINGSTVFCIPGPPVGTAAIEASSVIDRGPRGWLQRFRRRPR